MQQNQMQQMIEQLTAGMSPEEAEQTMQSIFSDVQGEQGALQEQFAQAQQIRNTPTGQGIQAGNQYVAQSPLSSLANVMNKGAAAYGQRKANTAQRGMVDESTRLNNLLAKAVVASGGKGANTDTPTYDPYAQESI